MASNLHVDKGPQTTEIWPPDVARIAPLGLLVFLTLVPNHPLSDWAACKRLLLVPMLH
jgi:hypothetical protein